MVVNKIPWAGFSLFDFINIKKGIALASTHKSNMRMNIQSI